MLRSRFDELAALPGPKQPGGFNGSVPGLPLKPYFNAARAGSALAPLVRRGKPPLEDHLPRPLPAGTLQCSPQTTLLAIMLTHGMRN